MTGTALTRYDGPRDLPERMTYSQALADANLLPDRFRRQAANVFYGVEYARMVDIPVLAAITGIHVIDGKPTASAGLMTALVRRAGHRFRIATEGSIGEGTLAAVATIIRADDPDHPFTSRWDVERAIRAQLLRRADDGRLVAVKAGSAWDKYLEAMLKARATSEVCRDAAEEALYGIRYTSEELGAEVDADGDVIDATVVDDQPDPPAWPLQQPPTAPQQPEQAPPGPEAAPAPEEPAAAAPAAENAAPDPADPDTVAAVKRTATAALDEGDVEVLRATFRHGKTLGLLEIDVAEVLTDTDRDRLDLRDAAVPLGALLFAAGQYVQAQGTRVRWTEEEPPAGEETVEAELVEEDPPSNPQAWPETDRDAELPI